MQLVDCRDSWDQLPAVVRSVEFKHEACVHSQRTAQVCGLYTVGVFLKVLHVTLFLCDYSGKRMMGRKKKVFNPDWLLPIFRGEICSGTSAGNDCSAWSIWNRLQIALKLSELLANSLVLL